MKESEAESEGSGYYLNPESGIFDLPSEKEAPSAPSPASPSESDISPSNLRISHHKRCRSHPGHAEAAARGRKFEVEGRIARDSLPTGIFKSDGSGIFRSDGSFDALSLFTPQIPTRRLSPPDIQRRLSPPEPDVQSGKGEKIIEAFFVIDLQDGSSSQQKRNTSGKRKTRLASLIPGLLVFANG